MQAVLSPAPVLPSHSGSHAPPAQTILDIEAQAWGYNNARPGAGFVSDMVVESVSLFAIFPSRPILACPSSVRLLHKDRPPSQPPVALLKHSRPSVFSTSTGGSRWVPTLGAPITGPRTASRTRFPDVQIPFHPFPGKPSQAPDSTRWPFARHPSAKRPRLLSSLSPCLPPLSSLSPVASQAL
jgi:hypothetical protein